MRQNMRIDQGRSCWGLAVCVVVWFLAMPGAAEAQQQYDLEEGEWVRQAEPEPGSSEAQLAGIRKLIAEGEGKKAKHQADAWIGANEDDPLMPEGLLIRGDANVARKHFFKSLFDYERLIREYPGSEQFHTAQQREFELAKLFMAGTKRRLWGMRILPASDEAEEIMVRIQERSPGSDLGEQASITLADYYFNKPQMETAADAYDLFLVNYPTSERKEWAMLRLIQANLARFKGPRFDATGLIDAGQRLKTYRVAYPSSAERMGVDALLIRIDESLAMRDMVAANWHVDRKQPLSAIYLYRRVIQDYPQTAATQDAIKRLADLGVGPMLIEGPGVPTADDEAFLLPTDQIVEPEPEEQRVSVTSQLESEPQTTEEAEQIAESLETIPLEPMPETDAIGEVETLLEPALESEATADVETDVEADVEAEIEPEAEVETEVESEVAPEPILPPETTQPQPEKP